MRILFYSPDSYGLGHVRRTIALTERILKESEDASALVLTGAPRAHLLAYPPRCDYVKLPSVTKAEDGRYVSRELDMTLDETVQLRGRLILEAAASFRPDVLFVDHSPLGLCREILPTLESVGRRLPPAIRMLGMRDVIDEPEAVVPAWRRDGVLEVLRHGYDLVLVFGQRDVFDPVEAYGIPEDIASKVVFAGYIGRNGVRTDPKEARRRYAPRTGRFALVTVGGGGDGNLLIRSFLEGYEALGPEPPFEAVLITGPLMSPRKRQRFKGWAGRVRGVTVVEYADDLPGLCLAADFVVSMGGYNTVCELAYVGARALIVPRTFPRKEQLLRARRLEARGMVRVLPPEEATPDALMRETLAGLDRPRPPRRWGLDFSGLDVAARAVSRMAGARRPRPAADPPCKMVLL